MASVSNAHEGLLAYFSPGAGIRMTRAGIGLLATVARRIVAEVVIFRDTGFIHRARVGFAGVGSRRRYARPKRAVHLGMQRHRAADLPLGAGAHARAHTAPVDRREARGALERELWTGHHALPNCAANQCVQRFGAFQIPISARLITRAHGTTRRLRQSSCALCFSTRATVGIADSLGTHTHGRPGSWLAVQSLSAGAGSKCRPSRYSGSFDLTRAASRSQRSARATRQ